jgi:hypothetical protein
MLVCLYTSKFSIMLSSFPSCGTATPEGRNFGADHLEGPSAAETQFYNKRSTQEYSNHVER